MATYKYDAAIWAGHGLSTDGSFDSGTVYNSWTEAGRVLLIAQSMVTHMRNSGAKILTDAFSNNNLNMIKQVAKSNANNVRYHIALHLDWSKAPKGTLPIYYKGSEEGKALAKDLNDSVMKEIGITTRGILGSTGYYETNNTKMTACIFECGGIKADLKYFDTAKECEAYGKALAKGLCKRLGIKFKDKDATTVKYPTNAYAKRIKTGLKTLGYYKGTINNKVTPEYTEAVIKFQKKAFKRKTDIDGKGGSNTWIAIQTFVNLKDSKYFKPSEFRCNCGHCTGYPAVVSPKLIAILEKLRKDNGPITITSCLRCKWKNSQLSNASSTSRHMKGKAADFYNKNLTASKAKRTATVKKWYTFKYANYSYANTPGMGNAVHGDVK